MAFGAETAYTSPVGYISHSIAGAGTSAAAETYIAPTLINDPKFAGLSSASPSGGAVVTFSGGVPTTLNGSYVLEITSGSSEGWWSTVVSSTATSITVNDSFPAALPDNVRVAVRKHATFATFLGFDIPGLVTYNGVDASDEIQVFNPISQSATAYAFVTASDWGDLENYPNGVWLNLVSGEPDNDAIIEPGTSVKVKRVGSTALSFTSTGTVKTTKTQVDIYPGFNFVAATQAASGTFGSVDFAPQLHQWDGTNTDYDELQKVYLNQTTVPFAAIDDGGPVIWNITLGEYGTSEPFAEGTGVVINRVGHPSSTITLQGSAVTP